MVLSTLKTFYTFLNSNGDPRVGDWPMLQGPQATWALIACYLLMVTVGPRLMAKREAFSLKKILIVYNVCLVSLSAWMMCKLFFGIFVDRTGSLFCQKGATENEAPDQVARVLWWNYISKFIEFADTLFFILRKKNSQITFLHVYHHSTVPFLQWAVAKYSPGTVFAFAPFVNSFIHTIMYSYYMLSAFGPAMQKYLWWKKYLTTLQLVQFFLVFLYTSYAIKLDCCVAKPFLWTLWVYMITLFTLFSHFYKKSYSSKMKKP